MGAQCTLLVLYVPASIIFWAAAALLSLCGFILLKSYQLLFHGINMQCSHKWQHGGDHIPSKAKWKREGLGGKHWIKVPSPEKDLLLPLKSDKVGFQ